MAGVVAYNTTADETTVNVRCSNADYTVLCCADISINLAGNPSVNYAGSTIVTHLMDYGSGTRYEMGYACAIATILFALMVGTNQIIQKVLRRVGD